LLLLRNLDRISVLDFGVSMSFLGGVFLFIIWVAGAAASISWALSLGATLVLGLVLWNSFFGLCTAVGLMAFWSREHWLGD
jgi:hypothetical protein